MGSVISWEHTMSKCIAFKSESRLGPQFEYEHRMERVVLGAIYFLSSVIPRLSAVATGFAGTSTILAVQSLTVGSCSLAIMMAGGVSWLSSHPQFFKSFYQRVA